MTSVPLQTLRSRGFALAVHAGLWLLLLLALRGVGGKAPDLYPADSPSSTPQTPVPVSQLESLFASNQWPKPITNTGVLNLFFTRYFVPPPSPAPPPPPTTKKIEVTYQGFYQTADGPKETILKLGDAFVTARIGGRIATNVFVADANMQSLTLTNLAAQTNLLPVNTKKEIEVPIQ